MQVHGTGQRAVSPLSSPYQTVSGAGDRWRNTVSSVQQLFKRNSAFTLSRQSSGWDFGEGGAGSRRQQGRQDMSLEEQREWEREQMDKPVNMCRFFGSDF